MPNPSDRRSSVVDANLTALGADGPYRLTLRHAQGVIVEYFHTLQAALRRHGELDDLVRAAQGFTGHA